MGVIVNKNNTNDDELSRRIEADLRTQTASNLDDNSEQHGYAENSEYAKGLKKTGRFSWVWAVLIILAIISLISIVFL